MAKEVLQSMPDRLKAAQYDVADAADGYALAVKLRDALVRQAADDGMHHRAIAAAMGFKSMGNVSRILAKPDEDDE
jgi:hypothetical protein